MKYPSIIFRLTKGHFFAILCFIALIVIDVVTRNSVPIGPFYLIPLFLLMHEKKEVILVYSVVTLLFIIYELIYYSITKPDINLLVDTGASFIAIVIFTSAAVKYHSRNEQVVKQGEELLNKEIRFRSTIDNIMEGCQIISNDWRYLYINDELLKQNKCSKKEELLGYTMMEKYPSIENAKLFGVLKSCMEERVQRNFENEFTFPDNSKSWFMLSVQPVAEGLFILSIDITEQKKAELRQKEYTHSLEEMIFMTSHEVRPPVTNILGISGLLDEHNFKEEHIKTMMMNLKESALSLDVFTRKFTKFIYHIKTKNETVDSSLIAEERLNGISDFNQHLTMPRVAFSQ